MLLKATIDFLESGVYAVHKGFNLKDGTFASNGFCFYCDYIEYDDGHVSCYYKDVCVARLSVSMFDDHDLEGIVALMYDLRDYTLCRK